MLCKITQIYKLHTQILHTYRILTSPHKCVAGMVSSCHGNNFHSTSLLKLPALTWKLTIQISPILPTFCCLLFHIRHIMEQTNLWSTLVSSLKIGVGVYTYTHSKLCVNHLIGSDSNRNEIVILPNLSSTIFALAILLQLSQIDWFCVRYFWFIPRHLRKCGNIVVTILILNRYVNALWNATLSCNRLVLDVFVTALRDNNDIDLSALVPGINNGSKMNSFFSLAIAAVIFSWSLHSLRRKFRNETRNSASCRNKQ